MYVQHADKKLYLNATIHIEGSDYIIIPSKCEMYVRKRLRGDEKEITPNMAYRAAVLLGLPMKIKRPPVLNSEDDEYYKFNIQIKGMLPVPDTWEKCITIDDFRQQLIDKDKHPIEKIIKFAAWEMEFTAGEIWEYHDEGHMYACPLLEKFIIGPDAGKGNLRDRTMRLIYRQHDKEYLLSCLTDQKLILKSKVVLG